MPAAAAGGEPVFPCPKCGAEIKLTETLAAPIVQSLRQGFELEKAKLAEQAKLDARADARREVEGELKTAKDELAAKNDEVAAKAKLLAEAQKHELELRKKTVALEERARALDLEVQRKLDAERAQVVEQTKKEVAEQQKLRDEQRRLKEAEQDKLVADLRAQLVDAQRRLEQGSQQTQGEVQELDLESSLRAMFPFDTIEPVAKGQFGGDCIQRVLGPGGQLAGSILWESKRTKNWSDGWLAKLRDDQRAAKADHAILLTQALPKGIERFGSRENVWVTELGCALPLAVALRQSLLEVAAVRVAAVGQQTKMELLYAYLTGPEFRRRVEAIVESWRALREDLDRERVWLTRQWAKREKEIQRALESSAAMYGDLQGIGGRALPEIEALESQPPEAKGLADGGSGRTA
jgi:hypothetical protein